MSTWVAHHCNRLCSAGCFSASRWGQIIHSIPLLPHKSFDPQQGNLPARRQAHTCIWMHAFSWKQLLQAFPLSSFPISMLSWFPDLSRKSPPFPITYICFQPASNDQEINEQQPFIASAPSVLYYFAFQTGSLLFFNPHFLSKVALTVPSQLLKHLLSFHTQDSIKSGSPDQQLFSLANPFRKSPSHQLGAKVPLLLPPRFPIIPACPNLLHASLLL